VPRIIYEPKGRAREYSALACNLYRGCSHGCLYCYAPGAQFVSREDWTLNVTPRKKVIEQLRLDAAELRGDPRTVLLCFLCDPYQPLDDQLKLTRKALQVLGDNGMRAQILTKGGARAVRDFDIFQKHDFIFGSTILFKDDRLRKKWEPHAAPIDVRFEVVREAKRMGIRTWISLEPVIDAPEALKVIEELHDCVDFWKIGKINHMPAIEKLTDWRVFYSEVTDLLLSLGAQYYIKNDLLKCLPPEGPSRPPTRAFKEAFKIFCPDLWTSVNLSK
jgi:DNA repair photolyase